MEEIRGDLYLELSPRKVTVNLFLVPILVPS